MVDRARPVRLTTAGRDLLAGQHADLGAACPGCGGTGLVIPGALAGLAARLERAAAGAPAAKPELDQTHCTVATKIRRVLGCTRRARWPAAGSCCSATTT